MTCFLELKTESPICKAVEAAWKVGIIVVVASAGNFGNATQ